jgi:hypothetical protein
MRFVARLFVASWEGHSSNTPLLRPPFTPLRTVPLCYTVLLCAAGLLPHLVLQRRPLSEQLSPFHASPVPPAEATILSNLNHPCIIKHHESFEDAGFLCIVTEFAEKGDLNARLEESIKLAKPLGEAQALDYFVQMALSLLYVHRKKILRTCGARHALARRLPL